MRPLCVVGPGATTLTERLAARLDGRVVTVERLPDGSDPAPDSAASYGLADDGVWVGAGRDRSESDLLDHLSVDYDFALLAGFEHLRLPTVVLGEDTDRPDDREAESEPLYTVPSLDDADLDELATRIESLDPYVTLESLVARLKNDSRADRAGAIATFTGRVRAKDDDDDPRTTQLTFEKYDGVAEERLAAIKDDIEARDGVERVLMHHRTGVIEDGEDIVFVVVLAGHRTEAFRAVEDGINRLKDEVPIFKKETTVESDFWVHDKSS
ncbi:molybdenum cofactor biosynthesis protein MoaE [Haloprofundus marisrubri]|uniref:Molybdenum cofactor biosynthesis protein MoaE n=1 Tax=Haloprofundus marisrubri TaxID=1514971 RepID=A0A0W1R6R9_9EURY|nr:molybdopterin synthase [Haloprofundus marisrubri]KTG08908.1 molybdenum cofactor biosynthesis protein MoaE [Haloprofundus marisrubri]